MTDSNPKTGAPAIAKVDSLSVLEAKKAALLRRLADKKKKAAQPPAPAPPPPTQLQPPSAIPIKTLPSAAPPLRVDAFGREIDAEGRPIDVRGPVATAAVNKRAQVEKILEKGHRDLQEEHRAAMHSVYWDPRMNRSGGGMRRGKGGFAPVDGQRDTARAKRGLVFIEPGTFVKLAEKRREEMEARNAKDAEAAKEAAELASMTEEKPDPVPLVEWWDIPLLKATPPAVAYPASVDGMKMDMLDTRVERPPLLTPENTGEGVTLSSMLTKEERKRNRRRRRQEKLRQRAEAIMAGLEAPPPPKVRLSNMMRVLTSEAIQDPTEIERRVREESEARKQYRERLNNERRLTRQQRKEKRVAKLQRDAEQHGYRCVVFKLAPGVLDDPSKRFKVSRNAQTWLMTGCALRCPNTLPCQLVVVEGCPRAISKYQKLMLHRIKWSRKSVVVTNQTKEETEVNVKQEVKAEGEDGKMKDVTEKEGGEEEESDDEEDEEESDEKDRAMCQQLWEGAIAKPSFKSFTMESPDHNAASELTIRRFMRQHNVEHFWDLATKL